MKIDRMNRGNWGKVRAFFDLVTQDGFTIKGFKLIEGINGLFVSMPSQKGNDDEYYDTIWIDSKQLREELTSIVISEYNNSSSTENIQPVPEPEVVGNNIKDQNKETSPPKEDVASPAFSDDDIPF